MDASQDDPLAVKMAEGMRSTSARGVRVKDIGNKRVQGHGLHFYRDIGHGFTLDVSFIKASERDRPYGSLFYISNTELTVAPANNRAWLSTLTFCFLGLNAAEYIQEALHSITDSDVANGWDNQVSSGGEPTLMYTLSTQNNHIDAGHSGRRHEFKTAYEANAGFSTDVNASLSWRWGRINTPWWGFNPQHSEYIQLGAPVIAGNRHNGKGELYVWAGTSVKYRFYSSLMQGQFRDSIVKLGNDEVEKLLAQAWLGGTWEFADNIRGSFFYRASSKEFKGPNAHYPVWAGLVISRAY